MKSDKLFDAIGDISDDMVISSLRTPKKRPKMNYLTIIAAACLCVVLLAIPAVLMLRQNKDCNSKPFYNSDSDALKESPMCTSADDSASNKSDNDSEHNESSNQNPGDASTDSHPQAPSASSENSVSSPSYDVTVLSTEVIDKIIKITYRGGSVSYTESTYTDNTVYNKGIFLTDITWDGKLWKIYNTQEYPGASVIMLISPTGNVKIFKSNDS